MQHLSHIKVEVASVQHGIAMSARVRLSSCPGVHPVKAVCEAIEVSTNAWTLFLYGVPVMVWGVSSSSYFSSHGFLWAIISDEVENHKLLFARVSRRLFMDLRYKYKTMETVTDATYELANRWVTWLGFREVPSSFPGFRRYELEN